jgi:uncharacterized protein (DUF1501 family)
MDRRKFFTLTGTFTGGALLLPDFLKAYGNSSNLITGMQNVVFIQLNGGNDGLNTFIPYEDPLYLALRPTIALSKEEVIGKNRGMSFHPALKDFAKIQQDGNLTVIQNVGYPDPNRSHFRSREIWETAASSSTYLNHGWLGRYLDLQCTEHQPTAGVNIDRSDNLALRGEQPNSITVKNPKQFKLKEKELSEVKLSNNPQLDFARKIAYSVSEGSKEIQVALKKSTESISYPNNALAQNLSWISRLIKGNLNTKVYYTSQNGFDTHDNQLGEHKRQLNQLNAAVAAFYNDLKLADLLQQVTVVIFSEFGRRVKDNGSGTDHGKAAPMFVIGGNTSGKVIGSNPNLTDLDMGDLKFETDFRSIYASILSQKLDFDPKRIGIEQRPLQGVFG